MKQQGGVELIGVWKLLSHEMLVENAEPTRYYGEQPKGFLVLTADGRMIGILTSDTRYAGTRDEERAALHKSMIAYSGRYRIEGNEFVTAVDVSWNEAWNGTEQRRFFEFDGDRLSITSAPQPSPVFPGKTYFSRLIFEREA